LVCAAIEDRALLPGPTIRYRAKRTPHAVSSARNGQGWVGDDEDQRDQGRSGGHVTSRHSSEGGRRGVAPWIIITAVVVLVIAAGTTAYLLIVGGGDDEASATCSSQVVLPVVTAPGAAAAITDAATAFDATKPVARSACVSTSVTTLPNAETISALADGWQQNSTAAPGMWVADSAASLAALESTNSGLTAGRDTKPMATSPVVLAVRTDDAAAVAAAGLSWQNLPAATGPTGSVTLPSGQHLILALPDPTTNRATSYALQSVVAAGAGGTVDAAAIGAAATDLAALAGASGPVPAPTGPTTATSTASPATAQPATTQEALTQLAAGTGSFTAVPVVQSDLVAFTATTPGLTGVPLSGGTVGDAVYAVPLTASWINPTMEDAAAVFLAYLRGPDGDRTFTEHGFVVAGAAPAASTGPGATTSPAGADQSPVLSDGGEDVAAALAAAIGAAPAG
jgi:hypothetical protein